ncbi:MAG: META domain-containing protein [Paracoccaceae bacterium]
MIRALAIPALLAACAGDETLTAYGGAGTWELAELSGAPPPGPLTLTFAPGGAVSGQAPCNRLTARQTAPYPWIALEAIATTRMACPDLAAEAALIDALSAMRLAEAQGDVLILTGEGGAGMVFARR